MYYNPMMNILIRILGQAAQFPYRTLHGHRHVGAGIAIRYRKDIQRIDGLPVALQ